jgi:transcriptional regulator with XRE-family HTH domain
MENTQEKLKSALRRFGSDVRVQRKRMNLTQIELAHKAGLTGPQLSQIENGSKNTVQVGTLARVSHALGLDLDLVNRFEFSGPNLRA